MVTLEATPLAGPKQLREKGLRVYCADCPVGVRTGLRAARVWHRKSLTTEDLSSALFPRLRSRGLIEALLAIG